MPLFMAFFIIIPFVPNQMPDFEAWKINQKINQTILDIKKIDFEWRQIVIFLSLSCPKMSKNYFNAIFVISGLILKSFYQIPLKC